MTQTYEQQQKQKTRPRRQQQTRLTGNLNLSKKHRIIKRHKTVVVAKKAIDIITKEKEESDKSYQHRFSSVQCPFIKRSTRVTIYETDPCQAIRVDSLHFCSLEIRRSTLSHNHVVKRSTDQLLAYIKVSYITFPIYY